MEIVNDNKHNDIFKQLHAYTDKKTINILFFLSISFKDRDMTVPIELA